jgi:Ion channel
VSADPSSISGAHVGSTRAAAGGREPTYRYGLVFALILAQLVFLIGAPSADWSRGVSVLISAAALLVAFTTARVGEATRRGAVAVILVIAVAAIVAIVLGHAPRGLTFGYGVVGSAAIPLVLVGGLYRLLRQKGVTLQAVAGALTIYLSAGLMFAFVISLVAEASHTAYFSGGSSGTVGDRVYFSFTTLTTTGYGDFTPATPAGHAIAVLEMLVGQLYLVTVIGLMIGNYVGRSSSRSQ